MPQFLKPIVASLIITLTSASYALANNTLGPLLAPEDVLETAQTQQAVIVDIRTPEQVEAVIPGAISAPYGLWRGPAENPGQAKTAEELSKLLSALGINTTSKVILVNQGASVTDFGATARVYWTLKTAGLQDLAIVNGGMNAWSEQNLETAATYATPESAPVTLTLNPAWTATRDDIKARIENPENVTLLDARPEAFYNGETQHKAAAKPGTLPHADMFVHSSWFTNTPAIVDQAKAKDILASSNISLDQEIVSFCNTGHWAATNWFALSELAGHKNVKLYPESLVGWSHANLPMDNTPSVVDNAVRSIKEMF